MAWTEEGKLDRRSSAQKWSDQTGREPDAPHFCEGKSRCGDKAGCAAKDDAPAARRRVTGAIIQLPTILLQAIAMLGFATAATRSDRAVSDML